MNFAANRTNRHPPFDDWPSLPTLVLFPAIVWLYYRLARRGERDMLKKFGKPYQDDMNRVPMFFPRRHNLGAMLGELL